MGLFTVDDAREVLASLRPLLDELVAVRAHAAEAAAAVRAGERRMPEWKADEARLDELMTAVQLTGVEVKGWAPLLLDFPADLDGVPVLLCWLEGDEELGWYHRADLGFPGRRRLLDRDLPEQPSGAPRST